jgi:hypothetical protein
MLHDLYTLILGCNCPGEQPGIPSLLSPRTHFPYWLLEHESRIVRGHKSIRGTDASDNARFVTKALVSFVSMMGTGSNGCKNPVKCQDGGVTINHFLLVRGIKLPWQHSALYF